jgi:aryl-alcohol dehydrogenase-like predicted oxidoreductase
LSLALSAGINFFDPSDVYAGDEASGSWEVPSGVCGTRFVVATKCGLIRTPSTLRNASASVWSRFGRGRRLNSLNGLLKTRRWYMPEYIARAVISSLPRLKTDWLDLFHLHSPPRQVLLDEEVIDTMAGLRQEGTIRFRGIFARNDDEALIALGMRGIDCLEVELVRAEVPTRQNGPGQVGGR